LALLFWLAARMASHPAEDLAGTSCGRRCPTRGHEVGVPTVSVRLEAIELNSRRIPSTYCAALLVAGDRIVEKARELDRRYGIFRAAEFGIAGIVGFLVAEAIIVGGLYAIYGDANVPSGIFSSPTLLALDVVAFAVGVTVGFFVNERTTARAATNREKGAAGTLIRLAKFQGVYVVGNAITIGVQLALLAALALSPAFGNIIGAIVAYPVSYFISMRVVWTVKPA
jgi:putative flippase GtrA